MVISRLSTEEIVKFTLLNGVDALEHFSTKLSKYEDCKKEFAKDSSLPNYSSLQRLEQEVKELQKILEIKHRINSNQV